MQKRAYSYISRFNPVLRGAPIFSDSDYTGLPESEITFLHYHDCWELGICRSGHGLFLSDGRADIVQPGSAILIPPKVSHYSQALDGECLCRFVFIDPDRTAAMLGIQPDSPLEGLRRKGERVMLPVVLRAEEYPALNSMINRLVADSADGDMLLGLRFFEVLCAIGSGNGNERDEVCADPTLSPAVGCMEMRYPEPISSAYLASLCHLSESQFRRRFRAAYGLSPHAYLSRLRCRIGSELLTRAGLTVAETAARVGFTDASAFFRQFRAQFGCSPSDFRRG